MNVSRIICLILISLSSAAHAKVGFRQLCPTTPVAVQRGKKTIINVRTSYTLNGAYKVFFDKPGMKMRCVETKPIAAPRRGRGSPGTPFRFEIDVPANQPLGVYEYRVATKTAVSSVAHVLVTDLPITLEDTKINNDARKSAQSVSLPTAVCGTVERTEDVDHFRFVGKKGQPVSFNIYAQRVTRAVHSMQSGGSGGNVIYLMDAILTLYGPNGQVVAQNDNHFGGDSLITCTLPASGEYVLQVRDARYVGNGKYVYCVEMSDKPYVHTVFPIAIQQGKSTEAAVLGHGLNGTKSIKLTGAKKLGWRTTRVSTSAGLSNPVSYLVSKNKQRLVDGRNTSFAKATPIQFPVGLNGRFQRPDQSHHFRFKAKKNAYYSFEVSSNRLHLPLDSVLEIRNAKGRKISEGDDGSTPKGIFIKDAQLTWRAPADGMYTIAIRDLQDRGGPQFVYHLAAQQVGEDFGVYGHYYYAQLAPGNRMMWFATISRRNGFKGPVKLQVDGLPKGVSFTPVTVPGSTDRCGIILSAANNAKIDASLVRVRGSAVIKDANGKFQQVERIGKVTCELQVSGGSQARCPISTQLVGVTNPLDLISVEASPKEITLKPGKKVEITVRIKRRKGFNDAITLTTGALYGGNPIWHQLPRGIKMSPMSKARLTGNVLEGKVILEAAAGSGKPLPIKRFPFAVMAPVSITFSIETNYCSNPIYLTVEQ